MWQHCLTVFLFAEIIFPIVLSSGWSHKRSADDDEDSGKVPPT